MFSGRSRSGNKRCASPVIRWSASFFWVKLLGKNPGKPPEGGETLEEPRRGCHQSAHPFSIKRISWKKFHKANTHSLKIINLLTQRWKTAENRRGIALPKTLRSSRLRVESKPDMSRRSNNNNVRLTFLPAGTVEPIGVHSWKLWGYNLY